MLKSKKILLIPFIFCLFLYFISSCKKEEIKRIIKVTTNEVTQITTKSAIANGTIVDIGEGIIEHGFYWSTANNPTIELSTKTQLGSTSIKNRFTSNLTNLTPNTTYYIRSYASDGETIKHGDEISFTTIGTVPTVTIISISTITENSAQSGGNVTDDGGVTVTARGVCWSTSQNPTTANSKTSDGTGTGSFTSSITGLSANTTYYVRAYATNSVGTAYDESQVSFTATGGGQTGIVTDIEGNVYNTVTIGTQTWMAVNLKTTKYNDGTDIPLVTNSTEWGNLTTPGYCWYNNNEDSYKNTYGALYNWYTVNTGKLCPTDWHVPADAEWTTLVNYLGGSNVAGGKMKETGTTHWVTPNIGATNESGFTALPGGYRTSNGAFNFIGGYGYWWFFTESPMTNAYSRHLYYYSADITRSNNNKEMGFSVRCVKD